MPGVSRVALSLLTLTKINHGDMKPSWLGVRLGVGNS